MQFSAKSILPSPVSARDVPDLFASLNISFNQYNLTRSNSAIPFESAKIPAVAAKVIITANGAQEAVSARESDLIEQLLVRWCSASRMGIES